MEEQVVALHTGVNGFLDEIPVEQVPRFLEEFIEQLRAEGSILKEIRESGDLTDETVAKLDEQIKKALGSFNVAERESLVS
jgi:F0F1-type ATP synthase alpha subunit